MTMTTKELLALVGRWRERGVVAESVDKAIAAKESNDTAYVMFTLAEARDIAAALRAQPAVQGGGPDPVLCKFYGVDSWPALVTAQEEHVLKLQDTVRRNVKPWEDTMPPTLLPKYLRETGLDAAEPKVQTVVVYGATPPRSEEAAGDRPCTCHPDDNPPVPCAKKYALTNCLATPAPASGDAVTEAMYRGMRNRLTSELMRRFADQPHEVARAEAEAITNHYEAALTAALAARGGKGDGA